VQQKYPKIKINTILHQDPETMIAASKDPYAKSIMKYYERLKAKPDYFEVYHKEREVESREYHCYLPTAHEHYGRYKLNMSDCFALAKGRKNILVIGDSFAADFYMVLAKAYPDSNFMQATGGGCDAVAYQYDRSDCGLLIGYAVNFALKNKLDAVVLSSVWFQVNVKALETMVAKLKAAGQKVIIVGPPIIYLAYVPAIIARWNGKADFNQYMNSHIGVPVPSVLINMRDFARWHGASYIDRTYYYCKDKGCPVLDEDGQLLIVDYAHLTLAGARYLGQRLLEVKALQKILGSHTPVLLPPDPVKSPVSLHGK